MYDILLFAGTTEGHHLAESLKDSARWSVCCFTATEYGKSLITPGKSLDVRSGRLTEEDMEAEIRNHASAHAWVIDATHPYAAAVTENIRQACRRTGRQYIRVLRQTTMKPAVPESPELLPENPASASESPVNHVSLSSEDLTQSASSGAVKTRDGSVFVNSAREAAAYLAGTSGNVLLTTGSKELHCFTGIPDYQKRLFARVLSLPSVVASCAALGFSGRNLICMQGPFSEEMNIALIHQTGAKYLVTKDTGREGGFPEKESAAKACGCTLVIIRRPLNEEGISVEECLNILSKA
ncbi:MAG: precorrin-6A/cobalt-precorrin-6A reductase [Bilifractor sp.]